MPDPQIADPISAVAPLGEPGRRRLYDFVVAAGAPVDRDAAARGVGIGRPLAAFHLDRLVAAGLLDVVFQRRSGRSGPGAGRPAKFYIRPANAEIAVSLPPRGYDVAADVLAAGIERAPAARADVLAAARERGRAMAGASADLLAAIEAAGYEPDVEADGTVRLRNCPFHRLVATHRDLTCSMNLALLGGAADAAPGRRYEAVARPEDGRCCVAFVPLEPGADDAPPVRTDR